MGTSLLRRATALTTSVLLLTSMLSFAAPTVTSACENQVALSGIARSYDVDEDHWVDGIVTNDTSQTLRPDSIHISWADAPDAVVDDCLDSTPIAPGEWVAFHLERPEGVSADDTADVSATAYPAEDSDRPLALTVTGIGPASTDEDGVRWYTIGIQNDNDVPVSSVGAQGIEIDPDGGTFADTMDTWNLPDSLDPGESASIMLSTPADGSDSLAPAVRVSGLEEPTLSISLGSTKPCYGRGTSVSMELDRSDGSPADGCRTIKLMASTDGDEWTEYRSYDTDDGSVVAHVAPDRPLYLKAQYWGDGDLGFAESDVIQVTPKVSNDAPTAPAKVRAHHKFTVSGSLDAGARSNGKSVRIITERKRGSRWTAVTSSRASADSNGHYSKSLTLSATGTYRIRAYRSGVGYTPYKPLKVTK